MKLNEIQGKQGRMQGGGGGGLDWVASPPPFGQPTKKEIYTRKNKRKYMGPKKYRNTCYRHA